MRDGWPRVRGDCLAALLIRTRHLLKYGLCALLFLCVAASAWAEMVVEEATLEKIETPGGNIYRLDANIDISFADELVEALHQGVGIVLELTVEIKEQREYLWDQEVVTLVRRDTVHYHRLARLYQLDIRLNGKPVEPWVLDVPRYHKTLPAALAAIGTIHNLSFAVGKLDAKKTYMATMQMRLVVDALPLGLIPEAVTSDAWRLETLEQLDFVP